MSFLDFASRMFPYWCLGAFMFWAVWKSDYKDLLRFEWKSFAKWFAFLCAVTVYRFFMIRMAVHAGIDLHLGPVKSLPVGAVFFTFWEDLCHGLPLVLLRRMIGTSKWTWPIHALAMLGIMIAFGSGHQYQGNVAAILLSFYIPFSVQFAQKRGFGTLMLGHILYDFSTIMTIRMALG